MSFDIFLFRFAEGGGLATTPPMVASLNAFPLCSPQGFELRSSRADTL